MTDDGLTVESGRYVVNESKLFSIRQINDLPEPVKEAIYRFLVPDEVLREHGIDQSSLADVEGNRLVSFNCPKGSGVLEVDIRPAVDFPDPLLYLELVDTRLNQIEVLLLVINDPKSERFETDRDWRGERTKFGTFRRNIPEEVRAMEAGLAPGQVRAGLRLSRQLIWLLEEFCRRLGHDYYLMEPLAYHNAIRFERMGASYVEGLRRMKWINGAFQPGGPLHAALDGSTPFRRPDAWQTIRGRSWAIHDGILGEPWHGIRMYQQVGKHAGVDTFPGGLW
jgi:hypothetical protein